MPQTKFSVLVDAWWKKKTISSCGRQNCWRWLEDTHVLWPDITNHIHANHSSHSNPLGPALWSHTLQMLAQKAERWDYREDPGCKNEKSEKISQLSCVKWLQKRYISGSLQRHKTGKSVTTAQTVNNHVYCNFFWVRGNCCQRPSTENYWRHCWWITC